METAFPATNKFFAAFDLLSLVAPSLDELSLVRVLGVNRTFRNVVLDSTLLRNRLGLSTGQEVLDTTTGDEKKNRVDVRINPLFEWFAVRCFGPSEHCHRVSENFNYSTTVVLLPHALQACQNLDSGVHNLCFTNPPVKVVCVRLVAPDSCISDREVESKQCSLSNATGVTIGEVLHAWASHVIKPDMLGHPTCIWVDRFYKDENSMQHMFDAAWDAQATLPSQINHINNLIYDPFTGEEFLSAHDPWFRAGDNIRAKWFKRTIGNGNDWYQSSRKHQNRFVLRCLQLLKYHASLIEDSNRESIYEDECEAGLVWPAMAVPLEYEEDDVDKKPYEVDFACGLVFNRQEVDLEKIWI